MEFINNIISVIFFLSHIAGQIYLILSIIKCINSKTILIKIIVGILSFVTINTPIYFELSYAMAHYPEIQRHTPEWVGYIIWAWLVGISIFGLVNLFNDYWKTLKRNQSTNKA